MLNKIELLVVTLSVIGMASAIYLVQDRLSTTGRSQEPESQTAQAPAAKLIVVDESSLAIEAEETNEIDINSNNSRMVIDDIKKGSGKEAKVGDTVVVHYSGKLQDGTEFDNSRKRGDGFEFTLGSGMVIKGWDEGVVGMKVGGERVLVIPPEKAYGDQGIGPISGGATLVFNIQLLEVKND